MLAIVVNVAQLVRASGCGPEGRGFEPHHSPHKDAKKMENPILVELGIKYGLDDSKALKLVNAAYQLGISTEDHEAFRKVAEYICDNEMVEMAMEELLEELKRVGFGEESA